MVLSCSDSLFVQYIAVLLRMIVRIERLYSAHPVSSRKNNVGIR